jgi:hypothetical protein
MEQEWLRPVSRMEQSPTGLVIPVSRAVQSPTKSLRRLLFRKTICITTAFDHDRFDDFQFY